MKQPLVRALENGRDWLLEENYVYTVGDGRTVFIPQGFIFDYASIPRIAWRLFPPATGKHRTPSLIHDWLVATDVVTWTEAANIFLQAMKKAGVSHSKRYAIYWAVRLYGPFHKTNPRHHNLLMMQKAELEQCKEYYSNVI